MAAKANPPSWTAKQNNIKIILFLIVPISLLRCLQQQQQQQQEQQQTGHFRQTLPINTSLHTETNTRILAGNLLYTIYIYHIFRVLSLRQLHRERERDTARRRWWELYVFVMFVYIYAQFLFSSTKIHWICLYAMPKRVVQWLPGFIGDDGDGAPTL